MKVILLPNNTASLMTSLIPYLKNQGINAVGFNFSPKVIQSKDSIVNLPPKIAGKISFFICFLYHLVTADAVHWIYGSGSKIALLILKFVALIKKNKFVEFCGTDVRSLEKMCADIPFYDLSQFNEKLRVELGTTSSSLITQKKFSSLGFKAMPNSPELADYLEPAYFSDFYPITRSVDLTKFTCVGIDKTKKLPLIVHMPSNPEVKGTSYFERACEKLKREGLIDYKMISGVPHEEAIEILKESDIVVDQLIIGEYGVLSIEAMALGKPVVCFIRPRLENFYSKKWKNYPVVCASIHNLEAVLKDLVLNPELRESLSKKGRLFVEEYHDAGKNAQHLIQIYKNQIRPEKSLFNV